MGNDASNIILNTKWTPEEVSEFTINLNQNQAKLIFGAHKVVTTKNLNYLLQETVSLYLLNLNVKEIKDAKVESVKQKINEWRKGGELKQALEPMEKWMAENQMKDCEEIGVVDYPSVIGTWMQKYKSTMDTL